MGSKRKYEKNTPGAIRFRKIYHFITTGVLLVFIIVMILYSTFWKEIGFFVAQQFISESRLSEVTVTEVVKSDFCKDKGYLSALSGKEKCGHQIFFEDMDGKTGSRSISQRTSRSPVAAGDKLHLLDRGILVELLFLPGLENPYISLFSAVIFLLIITPALLVALMFPKILWPIEKEKKK